MAEPTPGVALRDFFELLQRRKWIVVEVSVILVSVVAIGSFLQTPVYRAAAALLVETQSAGVQGYEELPIVARGLETMRSRTIETHKRLITRRPVLEAVIADLDLHRGTGELQRQISVVTFPETDLIEIHVDDADPGVAADIANAVADNYVLLNQEYGRASAASASVFLQEQLAKVKEQLAEAEEKVEYFKDSMGISDFAGETEQQIAILGGITEELASAEADAQAASAESRAIEEKLSREEQLRLQASHEMRNPVLQELEAELAKLEATRAGLLEEYATESSTVQAVEARIEELKQQLSQQFETVLASTTIGANPVYNELLTEAARSRARAAAARGRVGALGHALHQAESRLRGVPAKEKELSRLIRAQDVAGRVYTLLLEKYHEVRVAEAMRLSNARLVEPAVASIYPIRPRTRLNIVLACVFGLILGIILASLIDYLDDTIKDPTEVAELLAAPVLGTVSHVRKEEPILLTEMPPRSAIAEAFQIIRSNLSFVSVDEPAHGLVVTSASAGEGKTFVVANLGMTMARDGREVILVDSDLRRPTLHKLFGIDNAQGLSNVLVGERDLDEVLKASDVEGLQVLPSGPLPPNPAELLASEKMAQLRETLLRRADFVLFDSPPAAMLADAATLASRLDGVIFVVEQGGCSKRLIADARDQLIRAHGRIVGTVLNKISRAAGRYYYYYYHYDSYYRSEDA